MTRTSEVGMEDPSFPPGMCSPPSGKDQAKWSSSSGGLGPESRGSVWAMGSSKDGVPAPQNPLQAPESSSLGPGWVARGTLMAPDPQNPAAPLQVPESGSLGPGCVAWGTLMAPDRGCQATGETWAGHASSAHPSPGRCRSRSFQKRGLSR